MKGARKKISGFINGPDWNQKTKQKSMWRASTAQVILNIRQQYKTVSYIKEGTWGSWRSSHQTLETCWYQHCYSRHWQDTLCIIIIIEVFI